MAPACRIFEHRHVDFDTGRGLSDQNPYAIHTTKLGHKNWIFIGGKDTGWRSAVIYTFIEQVRSRGADPYAYFEWVFEKLMQHPSPSAAQLDKLLPSAWLAQRHHSKNSITTRDTLISTIYARGVLLGAYSSFVFRKILISCPVLAGDAPRLKNYDD